MKNITLTVLISFSSLLIKAQEQRYQIGDFAQGGIIFWLDETGSHGLVCSKSDQSSGISWEPGTEGVKTMALGDGPYSGKMNTLIIVSTLGYGNGQPYAASLCNELQITEGKFTYGDWYLPSKEELNLMFLNRKLIDQVAIVNGGSEFYFANKGEPRNYYWSSTDIDYRIEPANINEPGKRGAWSHNFRKGGKEFQLPGQKYMKFSVRAIRSF